MNAYKLFLMSAALLLFGVSSVAGIDWIAAPSYYTHEPTTNHRVNQFAPDPRVYHTPTHVRSVYRHSRSSLQIGDSIDQYHAVDEYGLPVRPYGEWRFPYRPFSVPYPAWGPAGGGYGGFPGYGFGGYGGVGGYGGIGVGSPYGPFGAVNGAGFPPPWNDGSYPDVRRRQDPPQPFAPPNFNLNNNINNNNNNNGNGNDNNININQP